MKLEDKIFLHRKAYESIDAEIPPFRVTRPELKEWFDRNRNSIIKMPNGDKPHYDEMRYYAGVELEIV